MNPIYTETQEAPVTAQEMSEELLDAAAQQEAPPLTTQEQEREAMESEIREGIAMLFEDGFTQEELMELTQDHQVRADVAQGKHIVRAAAAYLHRKLAAMHSAQAMHRRAAPVSRVTAAGRMSLENNIEQMSDAQFDAFSRKAREAAMMGKKVRM